MPLTEENGWLPDLDAIPAEVARDAKVMWLNYPNNPTGAVAEKDYYEKAIAFAREYDIGILHDAAYSEVVFDGYKALSFLEIEGREGRGHRVPLPLQVLQHDPAGASAPPSATPT